MKLKSRSRFAAMLMITSMLVITIASTRSGANTGTCGGASVTIPFIDVPATNIFFCSIAAAYFSGLINGTARTAYSPSDNVIREQMAAFVSRTMDQSLKRGSKRAILDQFWTPSSTAGLAFTSTPGPYGVVSDGADLWVASSNAIVTRIRASDGKVLGTWTGAVGANDVLVAKGRIFVTGFANPGRLYQIDPTQPPGAVTTLTSSLGMFPVGIAFDGARIWTSNEDGSVSIVTLNPVSVNTVSTGFSYLFGILYDGTNMWVADSTDGKLKKLDSNGGILQSVPIGPGIIHPVFDGTNIWVPRSANTLTVVRAATGAVLATLSGNGLSDPRYAAFDGERIMVTSHNGNAISLWKAADLTPLGFFSTGPSTLPGSVCSDGLNFWITLFLTNQLARF